MVDLSSLLSDEDLRRRYGTPTLDRAWDYVRRGKVLSCAHELDSDGFDRGYGLAAHQGKLMRPGSRAAFFRVRRQHLCKMFFVAALNQRAAPHVLSDILPKTVNPTGNSGRDFHDGGL